MSKTSWLFAAATLMALSGCGDDTGVETPTGSAGFQEGVATTPAGTRHEMVLAPAGDFAMGSNAGEPDERPVHSVYLDTYYIDKYEVTNAQYRAFTQATRHPQPVYANDGNLNGAMQPVVGVTWSDAKAYCAWAGLRLPTEAEWEKAARGTGGRTYPWGETPPDGSQANLADANTDFEWRDAGINDGYRVTSPVGSFPAGEGPYGTYDMAGNVWEWVEDWYGDGYYAESAERNPPGPDGGVDRVIRGGAWYHGAAVLRGASRHRHEPVHGTLYVGFRCARDG